ncbi:unnamed protein product [Arabidopsis lyrata]|nr:unnamed protein product [Arabidopsis lyrata]
MRNPWSMALQPWSVALYRRGHQIEIKGVCGKKKLPRDVTGGSVGRWFDGGGLRLVGQSYATVNGYPFLLPTAFSLSRLSCGFLICKFGFFILLFTTLRWRDGDGPVSLSPFDSRLPGSPVVLNRRVSAASLEGGFVRVLR